MKSWDEFRSAYLVAKHQSISAAAKALGVHRATVLRHIDAFEQHLGTKVFIREQQGYRLTEVGEELLRVASVTDEQLNEFAKHAQGQDKELDGEFHLTSVDGLSPLLMPAVTAFQQRYPKVRVRYSSSEQFARLEYGQVHLAIRSGVRPNDDNYVVQPFFELQIGLYASELYANRHGLPETEAELAKHRIIGADEKTANIGIYQWLSSVVPERSFVIKCNGQIAMQQALYDGVGIGFCPCFEAKNRQLIEVLPKQRTTIKNWLVTHGDQHRSAKVQRFLEVLRSPEVSEQIERRLKVN